MMLYLVLFFLGSSSAYGPSVPTTPATVQRSYDLQESSNNGQVNSFVDNVTEIVVPLKDGSEEKRALEDSRDSAKKKLLEAVGSLPDIVEPLRKLDELSEAGKADIDAIVESYGRSLNKSIKFWKEKMENVIRPYLFNPEAYLKLNTDLAFKSVEPKWNGSVQYKEVEKELEELVDNAITKMQNEFDKRTSKTQLDFTEAAWKKLQAQRAMDNASFNLKFRNQWLKLRAASGNTSEIPQFRSRISTIVEAFKRQLNEIYSS